MTNSIKTSVLFAASLGSLMVGLSLYLSSSLWSYILEPSIAILALAGLLAFVISGTYLAFWGMRSDKIVMYLGAGTIIGMHFLLIGLVYLFLGSYSPFALGFITGAFFAFLLDISYWIENKDN